MRLTPRPADRLSGRLLVVIALLAALAPFAIDVYLPAFPAMTSDLGASASGVQLTLTAFLLGAGLGQLVFGPWSDRVGRRPPLIAGTAICVVAGVVAAFAPTITVLIVARAVQGLSGAAGMVLGRAIISDVARGAEAARAFNLTSVVLGVAPVGAPIVGSFLAAAIGWRGLLLIVVGICLVTLVAVVVIVPETHPVRPRDAAGAPPGKGRGVSGAYLGYTATFVLGFAAMMSFISASPFVYQVIIGMSEVVYGFAFGAATAAIMAVTFVAARLVGRVSPARLLRTGLVVLVACAAVFAGLVIGHVPAVWVVAPLTVGMASMGLVLGNAPALALGAVPHSVGLASAFLGAGQFVIGAVVTPLVGLAGEESMVPLAIAFGVAAGLAGVACVCAGRARKQR
jgi:DHA1 family bicyclomycin/chloramphenicol resistance-like MFS transporter